MSESIRYESAERVRDFYREQGRKQERERIYELVHRYACDDFTVELDTDLKKSLAAIANGALSSGHDYGAQDERIRIIELLEGTRSSFGLEYKGIDMNELWQEILPWLVTTIKGENN